MAKKRTIRNVIQNARGKAGGRRTIKYRQGTPDGPSSKVKRTEVYSDGKKRKSKTVVKTEGGKRAKTKIKYNKDGTIKKVVSKIGGKRQVTKPKRKNKRRSRDTPLPKSDW